MSDAIDATDSQLGSFAKAAIARDDGIVGHFLGYVTVDVVGTRFLYIHVQPPFTFACLIREGTMHRLFAITGKEYINGLIEKIILLLEQTVYVVVVVNIIAGIVVEVIARRRSPAAGGPAKGTTFGMIIFLLKRRGRGLCLEGDCRPVLLF